MDLERVLYLILFGFIKILILDSVVYANGIYIHSSKNSAHLSPCPFIKSAWLCPPARHVYYYNYECLRLIHQHVMKVTLKRIWKPASLYVGNGMRIVLSCLFVMSNLYAESSA